MLRSAAQQLRVQAAAALGLGSGGWAAALHSRAPLLASLQVKIPALGESISDGTVAAVLKQPGDHVEEDEPILQIETDKVTVDVRAPQAGIIEAILVKPDDNVVVGHVVASIGDSAAAAAAPSPAAQAAAAPQPQAAAPEAAAKQPKRQQRQKAPQPAAAPAPAAAVAEPTGGPPHRAPSIRFPPRRTPDGKLISALPKAEAEQLLASLLEAPGGASSAAAGSSAAAPVPEEYRDMIAVPIVGGSMPILRGPPVPPGRMGPPRQTMSDREMEAIMLGGAEP